MAQIEAEHLANVEPTSHFIDCRRVTVGPGAAAGEFDRLLIDLRLLSLSNWLRSGFTLRLGFKAEKETNYGS